MATRTAASSAKAQLALPREFRLGENPWRRISNDRNAEDPGSGRIVARIKQRDVVAIDQLPILAVVHQRNGLGVGREHHEIMWIRREHRRRALPVMLKILEVLRDAVGINHFETGIDEDAVFGSAMINDVVGPD